MKVFLGILGDPAKLKLYSNKFYRLLINDYNSSIFYLIGASEKEVSKKDYIAMYESIIEGNNDVSSKELVSQDLFNNKKGIDSRIGLFPSSPKHLIEGPEFLFAPYPANSRSSYLKFKSKLVISSLKPIYKKSIIPISYHPQGGKAAERTKANTLMTNKEKINIFKKNHYKKWLKWSYIEAGSGENQLSSELINDLLRSVHDGDNNIVSSTIYGGGIKSVKALDKLIYPEEENSLIPKCIIIGNISEENVSITKKLVDRINIFNE